MVTFSTTELDRGRLHVVYWCMTFDQNQPEIDLANLECGPARAPEPADPLTPAQRAVQNVADAANAGDDAFLVAAQQLVAAGHLRLTAGRFER